MPDSRSTWHPRRLPATTAATLPSSRLPRAALLTALALLAPLAGCYAEWDLPRCASSSDCPPGYTSCYDGYCLAKPIRGVDKAALPDADVATVDPCAAGPALAVSKVHHINPAAGLDPRVAAHDGLIFAAQAGALRAISLETREKAWSAQVGAGAHCPLVLGSAVAVPHDGGVAWVEAGGNVRQVPVPEGVPGCLALRSDGLVVGIAGSGGGFAVRDGEIDPAWAPPAALALRGSPAVTSQNLVIALDTDGQVMVLGATGLPEPGSPIALPSPPDVDPIAPGAGCLVAGGGEDLVTSLLPPWSTGTPVAGTAGTRALIAPSTDGVLLASSKGAIARAELVPSAHGPWSVALGGRIGSGLAALPGGLTLAVESDSAKLYALGPDGTIAWSEPLSASGSLGDAVVVGAAGAIVIGTEKGGIYVLEVPCLTGQAPDAPWGSLRGDARNTGRATAP